MLRGLSMAEELSVMGLGFRRQRHVHAYSGTTSIDREHSHGYLGVTGPAIGSGAGHRHFITGLTTFDRAHYHTYRGLTGPAIMISGTAHTHRVRIRTSYNEGHSHRISDFVQQA
jgi:hypothetical protein